LAGDHPHERRSVAQSLGGPSRAEITGPSPAPPTGAQPPQSGSPIAGIGILGLNVLTQEVDGVGGWASRSLTEMAVLVTRRLYRLRHALP
jgi:hypothetical protein